MSTESLAYRAISTVSIGAKKAVGAVASGLKLSTQKTVRAAAAVVSVPYKAGSLIGRTALCKVVTAGTKLYGEQAIEAALSRSAEKAIKEWVQRQITTYLTSFSANEKEQAMVNRLLDQCLSRSIPSIINVFFSKISTQEMIDTVLRGIQTYGISPKVGLTLAQYLKAKYEAYLVHFPDQNSVHTQAAKQTLFTFIDTFTSAIGERHLLNIHTFFNDKNQLKILFDKALASSVMTKDNGKTLDLDQIASMLHLVMPDFDQLLVQILTAANLQTEEEFVAGCKLALAVACIKTHAPFSHSEDEHGRELTLIITQKSALELEPFFKSLFNNGITQAISLYLHKESGKKMVIFYFMQLASIAGFSLSDHDLDFLFEGNNLSSKGRDLLTSIEHLARGNGLISQLITGLFAVSYRNVIRQTELSLEILVDKMNSQLGHKTALLEGASFQVSQLLPTIFAQVFLTIPFYEILVSTLTQIKQQGLSPTALSAVLTQQLKQRYDTYLKQFPIPEEKIDAQKHAKQQCYAIIKTIANHLGEKRVDELLLFLRDPAKLKALIKQAIAESPFTQKDGQSPNFTYIAENLNLIIPNLDSLLLQILKTAQPKTEAEEINLYKLVFVMGSMKQHQRALAKESESMDATATVSEADDDSTDAPSTDNDIPKEWSDGFEQELIEIALCELEPFFAMIRSHGFTEAIIHQIQQPGGKELVIDYLKQIGSLLDLSINDAHLAFLFKGNALSIQGRTFLENLHSQAQGNNLITQLLTGISMLCSTAIGDSVTPVLANIMEEMEATEEDKTACLTSTSSYLAGALPPVFSMLLSKIPIQTMLPDILRQVHQNGLDLASAAPSIARALKRSYSDYLGHFPLPATTDKKHRETTQEIINQIIDALSEAISRQSWMALPTFLRDQDQMIAIIRGVITNSPLVDEEGRLDGDRLNTFLKLAIPDLENTIEEILVAGLPETRDMTNNLIKAALLIGGMQGTEHSPYLMDFARATTASTKAFLTDIDRHGLLASVNSRIEAGQVDSIKVYLCQVGNLFGVEIIPDDLNVFFTEDALSETGRNLLTALDANCSGKPLIEQLIYGVATLLSKTGHLNAEHIETAAEHLKVYAIKVLATIAKQSAVKPLAEKLDIEVKPTPATPPRPLLSKDLDNVVQALDVPLQTTTTRIQKAIGTITPWILYSSIIRKIGREDLASETFFLDHILPKLKKNQSIFIQAFEIVNTLSNYLNSGPNTPILETFKNAGIAFSFVSLNILTSLVSNQVAFSLDFLSGRVEGEGFMREAMRLSLDAMTNLNNAAQALDDQDIEKGSDAWNARMRQEIEEEKKRIVTTLVEGIKQELKHYPKNKFNYAISVLKNPRIPKKARVALFLKELFSVLISPIFMLIGLMLLPRNEHSLRNNVLYSVISSVFEKLDIQDNGNLLSTVVDTTNEVLQEQVDTMLLNSALPIQEAARDPETDVALLRFAAGSADQSSQFNNTIPLGKVLARLQTNLHGVASTTRENILKNLTAKKWKAYFASGLEAMVPSYPKEEETQPYGEKVEAMGKLVTEVTGAALKAQMQTNPKNSSQASSLILACFRRKRYDMEQICRQVQTVMRADQEDADKLMKKSLIHMVVFIQEMEKYSPYLEGTTDFDDLKRILTTYKKQLTWLTSKYTAWRESSDENMRFMHSLEFKNGLTHWMNPQVLDSTARVLQNMYDRCNKALDAPEPFHPMMGEKMRRVAEIYMPGFVSKTTSDLSNLVTCISVH